MMDADILAGYIMAGTAAVVAIALLPLAVNMLLEDLKRQREQKERQSRKRFQ